MVGIIMMIAGILGLYFLPTITGYKKKNAGAIFALNLLLGWTFIGWVVAFVWAATVDNSQQVIINTAPNREDTHKHLSVAEELKKLKGLVEEGILTQSEYEEQKEKLLK